MMNRKFSSGKSQLIGQGIVYTLPIPLDPAPYIGGMVAARDGEGLVNLYFSDGIEWRQHIADETITTIIEQSLDDLTLVGYDEPDLPNPLLPINLRRFAFNNTRGFPGFVWEDEWRYLTDEARVAEIAEEVAANVFRIQGEVINLTVNRMAAEVEGVNYASLSGALEYASRFSPAFNADWSAVAPITVQILIKAAHGTMREQIYLANVQLGHVHIRAENPVVDVDCAYLTKVTDEFTGAHAFIAGVNGVGAPALIGFVFRGTNLAATPVDPDRPGGAYTPYTVGYLLGFGSSGFIYGEPVESVMRPAGFVEFEVNVENGYSDLGVYNSSFNDATFLGILNQGFMLIYSCTATGCVDGSLTTSRINGKTLILGPTGEDAAYPGGYGNDFRKTVGVNSASDIKVSDGGEVRISGGRGGQNQPSDLLTRAGRIVRSSDPFVAVVSRGYTPTGEFVRFEDGTQFCWWYMDSTVNIETASSLGLGFRNGEAPWVDWLFPATFIEDEATDSYPVVNVQSYQFNPDSIPVAADYAYVGGVPGTASISFWRGTSKANAIYKVSLSAWGRWK